jgi:hypothetical protein
MMLGNVKAMDTGCTLIDNRHAEPPYIRQSSIELHQTKQHSFDRFLFIQWLFLYFSDWLKDLRSPIIYIKNGSRT